MTAWTSGLWTHDGVNQPLKTKDAETRKSGAGHVVVEAYLKDEGRWIMADGQAGVIPTLNGRPISAMELRDALSSKAPGLSAVSAPDAPVKDWFNWISEYLYFFSVRFDSRFDDPMPSERALMLVPPARKSRKFFNAASRSRTRPTPARSRIFIRNYKNPPWAPGIST